MLAFAERVSADFSFCKGPLASSANRVGLNATRATSAENTFGVGLKIIMGRCLSNARTKKKCLKTKQMASRQIWLGSSQRIRQPEPYSSTVFVVWVDLGDYLNISGPVIIDPTSRANPSRRE